MKKIALILFLFPFLLATQCDEDDRPCGRYVEWQKPNLISIENQQTTYTVGDVLWLSAIVDRNQDNGNATIDLFAFDTKLSYYIDLKKSSVYNTFFYLYLNDNTSVVEQGEAESNTVILTPENDTFKSKFGIKLLESGTYTLTVYNIASYNPNQVGCNFTRHSLVTDFSELESNTFTFEVQ